MKRFVKQVGMLIGIGALMAWICLVLATTLALMSVAAVLGWVAGTFASGWRWGYHAKYLDILSNVLDRLKNQKGGL